MNASAILLDVEGTTTPIDFVHLTLFPFAKKRIGRFVAEHFGALRPEIMGLSDEHARDREYHLPLNPTEPDSVTTYLESLVDRDRKSTPLKSIQGKIWREGYESGELVSEVFEDVRPAFDRWKREGRTIAIFSSGSVLAQRLLFRYTDAGDLTPFISHYFDTTTGPKREPESYRRIADQIGTEPSEIVFVSDIAAELDAARLAGLQTAFSIRPGNAEVNAGISHRTITTLAEI